MHIPNKDFNFIAQGWDHINGVMPDGNITREELAEECLLSPTIYTMLIREYLVDPK